MKRLVAILFVLSFCFPVFADVLYMNEGEEHVGTLEYVKDGKITLRDLDGKISTFEEKDVAHVLFSKVREGDQFSTIASLTDPFLLEILQKAPEPQDHPNSDYITLFRRRTFTFQPDGTVGYHRWEIKKILKEPGLDEANRSIYYETDREKIDLVHGHTYSPDGRIFHVMDDAVSDESLNSDTPEYDRMRKLKFALKKVDIGSIIDVSHKVVTRNITELRPYYMRSIFGEREPVLREEFIVNHPASIKLEITNFNFTGPNLPVFTEKTDPKTNLKTLTWTFSDPKGFIPEQNMLSRERVFPTVYVYPMSDWKQIASDLRVAIEKSAPSDSLLDAFIAESRASSEKTDFEKARKLYDAVIRKIRLLGISLFEMGGVDPVPVDVALTKRYGNNYARICLLYHAFKRLGIASEIGFVNTWDSHGIMEGIPNLNFAGSAILKIRLDGAPRFSSCDSEPYSPAGDVAEDEGDDEGEYTVADSDYLPFGAVTTSFQGANAWFVKSDGSFSFDRIPEGRGIQNRVERQVLVKIDAQGGMDVREIRTYRGPFEASLRSMKSAKEKHKQMYAERMAKKTHPNAILGGFALSNLDDITAPVVFTLNYRIPDAAIKASDKLLAFRNLWLKYNSSSASLASRTYPMEYWATEETVNSIIFELPEGFSWVPWGRDYRFECGCLSYVSNFSQNGGMMVFSDRFTVNRKEYDTTRTYPHYRNCVMVMSDLANQWIILEKAPDEAPAPQLPVPATPAPEKGKDGTVPPAIPKSLENVAPDPQG